MVETKVKLSLALHFSNQFFFSKNDHFSGVIFTPFIRFCLLKNRFRLYALYVRSEKVRFMEQSSLLPNMVKILFLSISKHQGNYLFISFTYTKIWFCHYIWQADKVSQILSIFRIIIGLRA